MTTLAPSPPNSATEVEETRTTEASPWRTVGLAAAALALAALLNGPELVRTAERQPLGWRRDVLVDVATAIDDVAAATGLDRPRLWLEDVLERPGSGSTGAQGGGPVPTTAPPTPPPATSVPTTGAVTPTTPTPTSLPPTTAAPRRRPSAEDPLRLWALGDSMMAGVGPSILDAVAGDEAVRAELEYRVSTGLTRPDYFDWPARLAEIVLGEQPDAVIVMFGANDAQGIVTVAGQAEVGTDAWVDEYRGRTGALMDQLAMAVERVYWIGQPIARADGYSARMAMLDDVYRTEADRRPSVVYIDSWDLFAVDGKYAAYIDEGDGPRLMRQSDGIHLTRAGSDRLARVVVAAVRAHWFPEDR